LALIFTALTSYQQHKNESAGLALTFSLHRVALWSAKGAISSEAWGNAPGTAFHKIRSAESAPQS
jgi:hypothetical protein